MSNLISKVQELQKEILNEFDEIREYQKKRNELLEKQEVIVKKTAEALLPIMEIIKEQNIRFTGLNTSYYSKRGPILKEDEYEELLYVFSVKDKGPQIVYLNEPKRVSYISYDKLLEDVPFKDVMENLLYVLRYHEKIKNNILEDINKIEEEIKDYENLF